MPITKSATKKMHQDVKRAVRNNRTSRSMKEAVREFVDAVKAGKTVEELTKLLRKAYKTTDTAAKKNLIHKNNASHKKSKMAKMLPKK